MSEMALGMTERPKPINERVARLVEIAHPDHRESLLEGARVRGWLPKFFTMPGGARGGVESEWIAFSCGRFRLRPLHPSDMQALQVFFAVRALADLPTPILRMVSAA